MIYVAQAKKPPAAKRPRKPNAAVVERRVETAADRRNWHRRLAGWPVKE